MLIMKMPIALSSETLINRQMQEYDSVSDLESSSSYSSRSDPENSEKNYYDTVILDEEHQKFSKRLFKTFKLLKEKNSDIKNYSRLYEKSLPIDTFGCHCHRLDLVAKKGANKFDELIKAVSQFRHDIVVYSAFK